MGNWEAVAKRLRGSGVKSVIDIGCGDGALLAYLRATAGISEVTGVDLKPPACTMRDIPITALDATRDPLPHADAAISVMLLHHLTDDQVVALIRNAGLSVKRFICLDPVRHPLPLMLYSVFLCPFLSRVGALDGRQSIRRSFRKEELQALVRRATEGTGATFEHRVSPIFASQIVDIRWPDVKD
jgi:SAM-dependent methyltransferase